MSDISYRSLVEKKNWKPRNVVWELTLACNLRCRHCGSRAGEARPDEMSMEESLDVASQLADMGAELVTLSGGEPTMKPGWEQIARRLADRGVLVNMVTNGFYPGRDPDEIATRAAAAGLCNVGISIDGDEEIHEAIRGKGTFPRTLESIAAFRRAGLPVGVLTTVNRLNYHMLERIQQVAIDAGAGLWRLQLGKPMGNMSDEEITIRSEDLLTLIPLLARLKQNRKIKMAIGDSIGYYGPHDKVLRGRGWRGRAESWRGCQAGMQALGIEANGNIKGCLSLQAKIGTRDPFVEGNLREARLDELWNRPGMFTYNREFKPENLGGFCRECRFSGTCRGGASCVTSSFTGKLGDDPMCHYRMMVQNGYLRQGPPVGVAAAAAALVLAMGPMSCGSGSDAKDTISPNQDARVAETLAPDNCCAPEYGVPWDEDSLQPDYGIPPQDVVDDSTALEYGMPPDAVLSDSIAPEYGMPPDTISCENVCCQCEYGIIPEEVYQACCETDYGIPADVVDEDSVQMDYGLPPDVTPADSTALEYGMPPDAISCENVCCDCEYGIIPEDVYKACCEVDPCEGACCNCDYGTPPPPECCE